MPNDGTTVSIDLYDINGRIVDNWVNDVQYSKGYHLVNQELGSLEAGSYIYRLSTSDGYSASKTLQIVTTVE